MQFIDDKQNQAKIMVIGVGGCGGNIVHYLQERVIAGVHYAAINTDSQALGRIGGGVECVQIGRDLTRGLGAGADPVLAAEAAKSEESRLREMFRGCDMVFVAAGMGKGTGTGASPVVARIAREENALTVAVVTRPFLYEKRDAQADDGLIKLAEHVDSLIVVPNEKLHDVLGDDAPLKQAFAAANDVLYNAVCGISEVITKPGEVNLDFNDVRAVMMAKGKAVIGSACRSGKGRASQAAESALRCPLMEDVDLSGAKAVLVNVTCDEDTMLLGELNQIQEVLKEHAPNCQGSQYSGIVFDGDMKDELRVTIIVTGLDGVAGDPSLEVVKDKINDGSFVSGRRRSQAQRIRDENGGDEKKVPTILRRQVS